MISWRPRPSESNHNNGRTYIFSPPARWGLLDFMSVAWSSSSSSSSSSPPPPPLLLLLLVLLLLVVLVVLVLLVQLRPAIHSVLCRTSTTTIHAQCSLPDLNHDHLPSVPCRTSSVPCRTSTTTIHAQCSLSDLICEYPRPVFPACRTSTTTIHAQCSLSDLICEYPRPGFPAGPQPRVCTPSVPCRASCRKIWDKECAEES